MHHSLHLLGIALFTTSALCPASFGVKALTHRSDDYGEDVDFVDVLRARTPEEYPMNGYAEMLQRRQPTGKATSSGRKKRTCPSRTTKQSSNGVSGGIHRRDVLKCDTCLPNMYGNFEDQLSVLYDFRENDDHFIVMYYSEAQKNGIIQWSKRDPTYIREEIAFDFPNHGLAMTFRPRRNGVDNPKEFTYEDEHGETLSALWLEEVIRWWCEHFANSPRTLIPLLPTVDQNPWLYEVDLNWKVKLKSTS